MIPEQSLPSLPQSAAEFLHWSQVEPFVQYLLAVTLSAQTIDGWLAQWTQLAKLVMETHSRRLLAINQNTKDEHARQQYHAFLEEIEPSWLMAEQTLQQMLLASGLQPSGLETPLRQIQVDAALFREINLLLITEEQKEAQGYNRISGAQMVTWEGAELTLEQLQPMVRDPQRSVRERAWRLASARQLADRAAFATLWAKLVPLRTQMAANAGFADYRAFRWQEMHRFDYTPDDCLAFHAAIEEVVVPAVDRMHERRRQRLGLQTLRPWDLDVDPEGKPALRPFAYVTELEAKTATILARINPQVGDYFSFMRNAQLLDLDNRKDKAPGGFLISFDMIGHPFIFMNAIGLPRDVSTLLHETGHAVHDFETQRLPYYQQGYPGAEFGEVPSMAMELLGAPYLSEQEGGFYTTEDAQRARREQLEDILAFWPYCAVVDAFQHWVYTHPVDAAQADACDAQWSHLWRRFMRGVDWTGLEPEMASGWQHKLHIFLYPFYYVEYGLAQLGAVQLWRNSLHDQIGAVDKLLQALALGNTSPLPHLYGTAGIRFAFDAATLNEAVVLIEQTIDELEAHSQST